MHRFNSELAKTSYLESERDCPKLVTVWAKQETKNILSTSLKPLHEDTSL